MLYMVSAQIYDKDPSLGSRILLTAIAVWFVINTSVSILVGASFNAVLNFGVLLMFEIPILWPKGKPARSSLTA